ncbi:MAG: M28 family peptidase [Bacteroidetes bacterium]|nr:M28 family peptidase [Bacteroidota bacterium]MDA0979834.1 M28 family peptidase [Bacteroidota bacterium]
MNRLKNLVVGVLFVGGVSSGCGSDDGGEGRTVGVSASRDSVEVPEFSGDSAYIYVERQVAFGPRVPNSVEHNNCGEWLADELRRHGADVIVQKGKAKAFDGKILELSNIVGQYNIDSKNRIMLYAHWDTRPFADKDIIRINEPIDGANDGGSGVGVLLEIARQLGEKAPNVGVDIVFFDGEDYGAPEGTPATNSSYLNWCLGSQFWAKQPHRHGYRARFGILLDMVGAKDAVFNREGTSMRYAPSVVRKVWSRAEKLGYGNLFQNRETPATVDDNLFVSELGGVPSVNIVDYRMNVIPMGYGPFHHTHADNMDVIDQSTLEAVGKTVLSIVYSE